MVHQTLQASVSLQQALVNIAVPQHFAKGALLFSQGELADGVYLVQAGSVGLLLKLSVKGRTVFRRQVDSGGVLGLPATLNNGAYSLTAKAMNDIDVGFIPRDRLLGEMNRSVAIASEIVNLLSVEVHDLRNVIRKRSKRHVRPRSRKSLGN